MKKIDFVNAKLNQEDVRVPSVLYKYRPFDEYTYDMLENEYIYLCPAKNLDDPSECQVDFTIQDILDLKTNRLTFKGVDLILEYVKPYTSDDNFQQVRQIIARTLTSDGRGKGPDLLEAYFEMQKVVPEEVLVPLINHLRNIPEKLNEPEVRANFEKLFSLAHDAHRDMGICSLSELKDSDKMWQNYANNSQGYCIEYNMHDYKNKTVLFPVLYQDNRETNIVTSILGSFIGEMIFGMSSGKIVADRSQFIRLFLTKDLSWSYQKEWRLIGDANSKIKAPTINAIYYGRNISEQNRKQLIQFCNQYKIEMRSA